MRTARLLSAVLLAALAVAAAAPHGAVAAARPNELVLRLNAPLASFGPLTPVGAFLAGPLVVGSPVDRGFYVLVQTTVADTAPLAAAVQGLPGIVFAEPNFIYNGAQAVNDPLAEQQTALADVEAAAAWTVGAGAGTTIAVLDTGVDLGHEDLATAIARNPGETPGNGADDDGNGAVDDAAGWNVVARGGDGADDGGHGTEVAGAAAARANNGLGIAGIAHGASILPVKVLDGGGAGATTDVADGIRYAIGRGARVLNLSLIGPDRSEVVEEALAQAEAANAAVVVAGGNQSTNLDQTPLYPAVLPRANILAVAAHQADQLASFSNRGSALDLSAPGVFVLTTRRGGGYGGVDGTSIAAPMAAGAIAVLASARPGLSAGELVAALGAAAAPRPVPGVVNGRLSVARALGLTPEQIGAAASGQPFGGADDAAGSGAASGAPSRLRITLRARLLRGRGARRTVRLAWTVRGGRAGLRSFAVLVDGRRVKRVGRGARTTRVRVRRGRRRFAVVAQDTQRRRLALGGRRLSVPR